MTASETRCWRMRTRIVFGAMLTFLCWMANRCAVTGARSSNRHACSINLDCAAQSEETLHTSNDVVDKARCQKGGSSLRHHERQPQHAKFKLMPIPDTNRDEPPSNSTWMGRKPGSRGKWAISHQCNAHTQIREWAQTPCPKQEPPIGPSAFAPSLLEIRLRSR